MTWLRRPTPYALFAGLLTAVAFGDHAMARQTFRAAVDVVQLDVSVLDANRQPVLGLTPADFSVIVDGKPRPVVAFNAVELPPAPPAPAAIWVRDIAPDVVANDVPGGRVVVIMIDDGSLGLTPAGTTGSELAGPFAARKMRDLAEKAVDSLSPADVAAVMFTESNRTAQDFTRDRGRLRTAIEKASLSPRISAASGSQTLLETDPLGVMRGSCACGLCSIEAVERTALALRALPNQRKTILFISVGVPVIADGVRRPEENQLYENIVEACNLRKNDAMQRALRQAQLSNVTIQAVDPKGLVVGDHGMPDSPLTNVAGQMLTFLRTVAENTGGRAVVNSNDMERSVPGLLDETRSYYLLGIDAGGMPDDGRMHRVQVRVNRPGVEVRTREGFYVPTARERRELDARATPALDDVVSGVVARADVPLDVSVTAFAGRGRKAALAIVLGVTRPVAEADRSRARTERVEVLSMALNPETGKTAGQERTTIDVSLRPSPADRALFEVMSRLSVSPGRYQVRLGVKTGDGRTGSVYTYAEVPDFERDALSASGLMLSAAPAPKTAPPNVFADLTTQLPTARRVFHRGDDVLAFMRVYRRVSETRLAVPQVTTRLTDVNNEVVAERVDRLPNVSWPTNGTADYRLPVPTRTLVPGEYLLSVAVAAGPNSVTRHLRFRIE